MTELHVHLDGSLRPNTVWEMAAEQGIRLKARTPEALAEMLTAPPDCKDLNQYLSCFDLPLLVLQEPESVARAVRELILDMTEDGVTTAEIRFAPQLHGAKGYGQREITEGALQGLREGCALRPGFHGSLILCCMRGDDNMEANEETLRTASAFLGAGICAVDLAGAEAPYPTAGYENLFAHARNAGLPFTIHAGEAAGPESVWNAVRFGAKRIGHGIRSVEDPALCRYLAEHKIPLEICYTSNLQTRASGTNPHPIRQLFDMGIHVTFNTDNRTVSHTAMTRERQLLTDIFGFSQQELTVMEEYACEGRFT